MQTDEPTAERVPAAAAPWLMVIGVLGVSSAVAGLPSPLLTSLLLVGLGADADLARRAALLRESGAATGAPGVVLALAAPARIGHAALYAALYVLAWRAICGAGWSVLGLSADLGLSAVLLLGLARRRADR